MNFFSLIALSFAMSMDAFAVAIAKGALLEQKPSLVKALKIGLLFGLIEGITPFIGWALGHLAHQWIEQWDHWIAFSLLTALGLKVIYEYFTHSPEDISTPSDENKSWWLLILTAIGTSLDAMTVGISLAFLDVNIFIATIMIGLATTLMVTLGILIGQKVGQKWSDYAELLGGITLIVIGSFILYSHVWV